MTFSESQLLSTILNDNLIIWPPDKIVLIKYIFLISETKHILWVLKRTVSMRHSFQHQKHMYKQMDKKLVTILCFN